MVAACFFSAATAVFAGYLSADKMLARLKQVVALSPTQEVQARVVYQRLQTTMDSMDPALRDRLGVKARTEARESIRNILTPSQRDIFDRTPQTLGGGLEFAPKDSPASNKNAHRS